MNIREINRPVTAEALNESLAKKFGERIALEKFTLDQLEDARNKIRTSMSQVEATESFERVQSETYQKSKLFLDVLNAEIAEREDIAEKKAKPDFLDVDKDGDKKEPMKKALKDKKQTDEAKKAGAPGPKPYKLGADKGCKPGFVLDSKTKMCMPKAPKGMSQDQFNKESIVREGAEDQAEIVMAAKDMVNRVTGWMEDTAEMQTESMLELADAIRDEQGQEMSDNFVNTVKPALESLYTALESTRESLTSGVGQLTGEAAPVDDMGAEPDVMDEPEMEPTVDGEEDLSSGLDASEPAAGGEEEAGREMRESQKYAKRRFLESSRKLGTILSKKK